MNNPHVEERFEELKNMLIGLASQDGDMLPLMQEAVKIGNRRISNTRSALF